MSGTQAPSIHDMWVTRVLAVPVFVQPSGADPGMLEQVAKLTEQAKRIHKDITTEVSRATRPMALQERLAYCQSELVEFNRGIDTLDALRLGPGGQKKKLQDTATALAGALDKARDAGIRASAEALVKLGKSLEAEATAAIPAPGAIGVDTKAAYKTINALVTRVARERTDWAAQVKEASASLGRAAAALEGGVAKLQAIETELNEALARCLPPLTSKIGVKPVDAPGGGGGTPKVDDPAEAMKASKNDWVTAKQTYGADPVEMRKLAKYRKDMVDKWLVDNLGPLGLKVGPGLGWVSVGSDDPTSDYDISINKHGHDGTKTVFDYEIVARFNKHFRDTFGIESGTLFDTNLYASAPPLVPELEDATPAELEAQAELKASADVGALMKIRRYMSSAEFESYRARTVEAVKADPKKAKAIDAQFRAADANYMISLLEIVEKMRALLDEVSDEKEALLTEEQKEERAHARHLIDAWTKGNETVGGLGLASAEEALETLARELEHARDASTLATNDLYADAIKGCRGQEAAATAWQTNLPEIKRLLAAPAPDLAKLAEQLEGLGVQAKAVQLVKAGDLAGAGKEVDGQLAGMLSDLARQQALSMFYANEAYQAGGPLRHVVWAGQAVATDCGPEYDKAKQPEAPAFKDLTKDQQAEEIAKLRAKRRAELAPEETLESFNEQLGDFLKDLNHYGDKDPGVAIIQSSKYLERLVDALRLMQDKAMFAAAPGLAGKIEAQLGIQANLSGQLIAARKGNLWMEPLTPGDPVDQVEQRRAFACDFMKKLGIPSVAALGKTYIDLGIEVNAAARKAMTG